MNDRSRKLHFIFTLLLAAMLPFGSRLFPESVTVHAPMLARLISVVIILIGINWLVQGNFKEKIRASHSTKLGLLFAGLFIIQLIGMIYTSNTAAGGKELETKLSLLLFPLFYCFNYPFTKEQVKTICKTFIFSCLLASVICFIRVMIVEGFADSDKFFYSSLSYFIHAGYFSMYLSFGICMLAWLMPGGSSRERILYALLIMIFLVVMVFLASKAGIVVAILLGAGFSIAYVIKYKKYIIGGVTLLLLVLSGYFIVTKINAVGWRFLALKNSFFAAEQPDKTSVESSSVRRLVWSAAVDTASEHWLLGAGTGDGKDELLAKYKEEGMTGAYEKQLNAHSEYLQHLVALGIIGLLVLGANLLVPLFRAVRRRDMLYYTFLIIIILNFATEAMLETQAGVIFYAFFNAILASRHSAN